MVKLGQTFTALLDCRNFFFLLLNILWNGFQEHISPEYPKCARFRSVPSTMSGLMSNPTAATPRSKAACNTVPLPQQGSTRVSPGLQHNIHITKGSIRVSPGQRRQRRRRGFAYGRMTFTNGCAELP
eukprot:9502501-Pyramimonas_sp.AAC.1